MEILRSWRLLMAVRLCPGAVMMTSSGRRCQSTSPPSTIEQNSILQSLFSFRDPMRFAYGHRPSQDFMWLRGAHCHRDGRC
ncbi:hypothetical protein BJY04DRAFT_197929 [Aspergillus karnatakaensis]|uniref:uncharacterized protein n=1 Tax=Aspergillus karnatakaensis TaxID=1810916 RepID=UPI003CCCA052